MVIKVVQTDCQPNESRLDYIYVHPQEAARRWPNWICFLCQDVCEGVSATEVERVVRGSTFNGRNRFWATKVPRQYPRVLE